MSVAHDSWSEVYDRVYTTEFGRLYRALTDETLQLVDTLLPQPGVVLDVGAGTGRLATPLAEAGHHVVAVEPSAGMLAQMRDPAAGRPIERHCCRMAEFDSPPRFDLALCVFTVISYLVDDTALRTTMSRISGVLKPGGQLLIDVPSRVLFHSRQLETDELSRSVEIVDSPEPDVYTYREFIRLRHQGRWREFADEFALRWWSDRAVLDTAAAAGLNQQRNVTGDLPATGSEWWVLQKDEDARP